jgi:hypothetical protein
MLVKRYLKRDLTKGRVVKKKSLPTRLSKSDIAYKYYERSGQGISN